MTMQRFIQFLDTTVSTTTTAPNFQIDDGFIKGIVIMVVVIIIAVVAFECISNDRLSSFFENTKGFGNKKSKGQTQYSSQVTMNAMQVKTSANAEATSVRKTMPDGSVRLSEEQRLGKLKDKYKVVEGIVMSIEEKEEITNFRDDRVVKYKVYYIHYTFVEEDTRTLFEGVAKVSSFRPNLEKNSRIIVYYEPFDAGNNFTDYNMPRDFAASR